MFPAMASYRLIVALIVSVLITINVNLVTSQPLDENELIDPSSRTVGAFDVNGEDYDSIYDDEQFSDTDSYPMNGVTFSQPRQQVAQLSNLDIGPVKRSRPKGKSSRSAIIGPMGPRVPKQHVPINLSPMKAMDIVKILRKIAARKGLNLANKSLRYGISRRSEYGA
ncbi:hypothetical protein HDE_11637 [Halotydeus destructor]|nr:hypothetical protein HDE_11637 [Halotydeus destructor]